MTERPPTDAADFLKRKHPTTTWNFGIIEALKYANVPAVLVTPEDVTQEVSAPMCSKSIPNSTIEPIPYGYCHCGCGEKTSIARQNNTKHGHVKGEPVRFISRHGRRRPTSGGGWSDLHGSYIIPLTRGEVALVDEADFEALRRWSWCTQSPGGYAVRRRRNDDPRGLPSIILMHRVIMLPGDDEYVDHINHNPTDNRRANLRICTNAENSRNRDMREVSAASGYRGVYWSPGARKWESSLGVNGRKVYLGLFETKEMAARARDKAAAEVYGEFATFNDSDLAAQARIDAKKGGAK